jgi:hypothetical protein
VSAAVQQWLGKQIAQQPDLTLMELQERLQQTRGLRLSIGRLWLALQQMGLREKKSLHAQEQETPEAQRRQAWWEAIKSVHPDALVFLDESGASTQMTRNYGRALRGERVREGTPNSHWHTVTMLAALTRRGFLFLVWPCAITPSVPSTVGFFVFGDLGFVLQGHSNLVQTEQQAGAGERINRKLGGKTVHGRNCAVLQIDGQLESTGLGTRHKITNLCRRESH